MRKILWSLAISCSGLLLVPAAGAFQSQPAGAKTASTKPTANKAVTTFEVEQPATPAPPPTPEQQPAVAPQVSYSAGQLTIVAQNSTLSDILRAVRQQTGATVDVPSNATERVVAHLGPAPARDVLAALLNGSHFNYVMMGTESNPNALDRVILTQKTGGTSAGATTQVAGATPPGQPVQPTSVQPEPEGEAAPADDFSDDGAADQDAQQQPEPQPDPAEQQAQQQQAGGAFGQPGQPNVRSPEQLLLELQQRQALQQQQQQGGAPTPAAPQGFPIPPGAQPGQSNPPQ
ncbi:MAG: hypothetical protein H0X25_08575 [Acidobacteriales bacterium]|nr:hypothetical protein [Terriglobales bacterium]